MVYAIAGIIAFVVATIELLTRYRDDPIRAAFSRPSLLYAFTNAAIAVFAAWLLLRYNAQAFINNSADQTVHASSSVDDFKVALAAGVGSLAALRSSVLKIKLNGSDVSFGPALIIEQFLSVIDRNVDRNLALTRARISSDLSKQLSFDPDAPALIAICLGLLQNHKAEEQHKINEFYAALKGNPAVSQGAKSTILILALLETMGEKALREAVKQLKA